MPVLRLMRVRGETLEMLRREIGIRLMEKGKRVSDPNILEELMNINRELERRIRRRI